MEEYWLKKACEDYEHAPGPKTWDNLIWELEAEKSRHQLDLKCALENLERLARLVPDMLHKAKNRETYNQRTR